MGFLCENVARRANAEEDRVGHFWQARFRCRECTDKNAVLLCGIYVDLNLIRAGEADSLESSPYTSIFQRLQARNQPKDALNRADGWLGELTWDVSHEQDASARTTGRGPGVARRTWASCRSSWRTMSGCCDTRWSCCSRVGRRSRRTWRRCSSGWTSGRRRGWRPWSVTTRRSRTRWGLRRGWRKWPSGCRCALKGAAASRRIFA